MRFALDADQRFWLVARDHGWELEVDEERVHYCRTPTEGLRYMAEELGQESAAEGVYEVIETLRQIEQAVTRAATVVSLNEVGSIVARVLKHDNVRDASLELAGCRTESEFRSLPERRELVTRAKAILEAAR